MKLYAAGAATEVALKRYSSSEETATWPSTR